MDRTPELQPTSPKLLSVAGGAFAPIAPYTGVAGRALMVRTLDGKSELSIALTGMTPGTAYTAHLHAAACRFGGGGGHYKIDPAVVDVIESNELWLKGTSSAAGALFAAQPFAHVTRGEALSIVVHDPVGGARMACADLLEDDGALIEAKDSVRPLATATGMDLRIGGMLEARRTPTGTTFALALTGLDAAAVGYETHIHAAPCEVGAGGGHYKLDPTVATTIEANEIWLPIANPAALMVSARAATPHAIRSDAQSLVLHRVISDTVKPKVACANLTRTSARNNLDTLGIARSLKADVAVTGSAVMTRKLTGITEVTVVAAGLAPRARYTAHVHDQMCSADNGGSHFKFDRTVTEAVEENELWFDLAADADGAAHDSIWTARLATADAASVVVHGEDGARIACFDLD